MAGNDGIGRLDRFGRGKTGRPPPRSGPIAWFHILGPMMATNEQGDDLLPRGKKARAMLGYLCLAGGQPVSRARLAALLWDRVPQAQARNNFRGVLRGLVAALGPTANELMFRHRNSVGINSETCWVDAVTLLNAGSISSRVWRSHLTVLYRWKLLEGLERTSASFNDWLMAERARFSRRLTAMLESELQRLRRSGADPQRLAAIAHCGIAFDPTNEGILRTLMQALVEMGEQSQAAKEYIRCRQALRKTLDVAPSAETDAFAFIDNEALRLRAFSEFGDRSNAEGAPIVLSPRRSSAHSSSLDPNRIRVSVLPFLITASTFDRGLALSLGQQVANALARFAWLDVITSFGRQSTAGLAADEHRFRRDQLDYVVEGALIGDGRRLQAKLRLLDLAQYSRPIWGDRLELAARDLHRLAELITARVAEIAARMDPTILFIDGPPKRRGHGGAAELLRRAIPLMYSMERGRHEEAGHLIDRSLELDPGGPMAAAWAAYWQALSVGQGWTQDIASAIGNARKHTPNATTLVENVDALAIQAHVCSFLNQDFDTALGFFNRGLQVDRRSLSTWKLSALTYCYIGRPEIAVQRLERCRSDGPLSPAHYWLENAFTIAYTVNGDYERAVLSGRRAVVGNPNFVNGYKPLIAALGHLGRREEAKPHIDKLLSLEPGFTIERFGQVYPFKHATDRERYMMGLHLAGVPER